MANVQAMPASPYVQTARLGEGVIYVQSEGVWAAGWIIKQMSDTLVNLIIADPTTGALRTVLSVEMGQDLGAVRQWVPKPKT